MSDPSALPVRPAGTRSRAGNAMERTRAAALDGALRCIEKQGTRKATMSDIAAVSGIAKATLYNHFRTKNDVYAAAVAEQVSRLGEECLLVAADGVAAALALAAERIAHHPAVRRVAAEEPAVLAALATPTDGGTWSIARSVVSTTLVAAGSDPSEAAVDVVLRWLASHLLDPGSSMTRARGADLLAFSLAPGRSSGTASAAT